MKLGRRDLRSSFCTRTGFVSAVAAALMLALAPSPAGAHSSKPKPFKEASITLENHHGAQTTIVVGHDDEKYTHILNGKIVARFRLKAKVKLRHRIMGFVVTTGDPSNQAALPNHIKGAEKQLDQRKLDSFATFTMDIATALSTGIWGNSPTTTQDIIDKCNTAFSDLPDSNEGLEPIELTIHAGFSAAKKSRDIQAGEGWFAGGEGRPGIAHTKLPITIVCQAFRRATLPPPPPPRAKPRPIAVDLDVKQRGSTCPKRVTATAYADYLSPRTKARLRLAVGNGVPKIRVVKTRKVEAFGKVWHRAQADFDFTLDPGQKTFKLTVDRGEKRHSETIEIKCPPFKVTSAWLKYEVEDKTVCPKKVTETATFHTTRPGWVNHEIKMPGGLVVSSGKLTAKRMGDKYVATAVRHLTMNAVDKELMADAIGYPANSGWMPLKVQCLDLKGDFSFVDHGAPKCSRTGKALISFKSNMANDVQYELDCTNGRKFSGVAKMAKTPQGGYLAAAIESFAIDKTAVYSCALKTVQPGPVKLHQWKGHTFDCVRPAVATGANDVQVAPKPQSENAGRPNMPAKPKRTFETPQADLAPPARPSGSAGASDPVAWPGAEGVGLDVRPVVDPVRPGSRKPDYPGVANEGGNDETAAEKRREAQAERRKAAEAKRQRDAAKKAQAERRKAAEAAAAERKRLRQEAENKRRKAAKKTAEAKRKRDAAKKAQAERRRKAAEKAAEAKRQAARKKAEAERKKKAEAARKRAAEKRKKAAERRNKAKAVMRREVQNGSSSSRRIR